jgi:hypothetical protein
MAIIRAAKGLRSRFQLNKLQSGVAIAVPKRFIPVPELTAIVISVLKATTTDLRSCAKQLNFILAPTLANR